MFRFSLLLSLVSLASCAPKNPYYFASSGPGQNGYSSSIGIESIGKLTRNDLSANLGVVIYDRERIAIETGIIASDSLPGKKSDPPPNSINEREATKVYLEKKKAYIEAKNAHDGTKNKKRDGFAIFGAILFTVALFCIPYPVTAIVFGSLGLIASILGLKSRIWGLSLAMIIATVVVAIFYIYLNLLFGSED